jgi:hypothetical protein
MVWQWRALRSRDREMAALRRCNILVHDYQVPEPLVDAETPVAVTVGSKALYIQPLRIRQLQEYYRLFVSWLADHSTDMAAIDAMLSGNMTEEIVSFLKNKSITKEILYLVDRALLRMPESNPDKITKRYLAKNWTADHMIRIMYALWQYNSGEFYKKKLQAVQQVITGHMLKDWSQHVKRSDSSQENTYQSPFRDSPFYPAHLRKSQSEKDKSLKKSEKKEAESNG